ncbi:MAG: thioredoxin [Vicinamibacteria bacterium]
MNDKIVVLTTANWENEVLQSKDPVLVDFWAEWCAPCRMIAPLVEAVAEEYAGRLRVGKLDVDESPEVAGRYDIRSIPSLLVFKGGQVVEQRVGALPKQELARLVDRYVGAGVTAQS